MKTFSKKYVKQLDVIEHNEVFLRSVNNEKYTALLNAFIDMYAENGLFLLFAASYALTKSNSVEKRHYIKGENLQFNMYNDPDKIKFIMSARIYTPYNFTYQMPLFIASICEFMYFVIKGHIDKNTYEISFTDVKLKDFGEAWDSDRKIAGIDLLQNVSLESLPRLKKFFEACQPELKIWILQSIRPNISTENWFSKRIFNMALDSLKVDETEI